MNENLDKQKIYTLVGYLHSGNTFTTLEGQEYYILIYRCLRLEVGYETLVAINIKWIAELINEWVAFQVVKL